MSPAGGIGSGGPRHTATPAARRLAERYGVDLATVRGAGGRVHRRHVLAAGRPEQPPVRTGAPDTPGGSGVVPRSMLALVEVDYRAVDRVRDSVGDRWRAEEGFPLTRLPFVLRAVTDTLRAFPGLNGVPRAADGAVADGAAAAAPDRTGGTGPCHLAVAPEPAAADPPVVVRHAGDLRLRALARAARPADGPPTRSAAGDGVTGGRPDGRPPATFGVLAAGSGTSDLLLTTATLDPPQRAVLAVGPVRPRPVAVPVDGSQGVAVHPVGTLALTFDPAEVPADLATSFLAHLRHDLEDREWATEL